MKLQQTKTISKRGIARIILEFTPGKDKEEQKVIRALHSANFNDKILLRNSPTIEIRFNTKQKHKVLQKLTPQENTRPELIQANRLEPMFDQGEYEAAQRTTKAHSLLRSLGIALPASLAKRFVCRCGLDFTLPRDFISHRHVCPVLHLEQEELLSRGKILEAAILLEKQKLLPKVRSKETFECRCSHVFSNKRIYAKHQKICSVISAAEETIARCKDYLSRHKDEEPVGKGKGKRKTRRVGQPLQDKATKRKQRRKRTA